MKGNQSHGRLGFWTLAWVVGVPAIAALAGGGFMAYRAFELRADLGASQGTREQLSQVTTQAKAVADGFWNELESLKVRAVSILQLARAEQPEALPTLFAEGKILYWAELSLGDSPKIIQGLKNPAWSGSAEAQALDQAHVEKAIQRPETRAELARLSARGMALLRFKQDSARNNEWLALIFPVTGPVTGHAGASKQPGAVLALVDPAGAFPVFTRFTQRSEGGALRAYLLGSDGIVLAHSQRSLVASDFSPFPLYQNALKDLMQGKRTSGSGTYKAHDDLTVAAAYARAGELPLGIVVERARDSGVGLGAKAAPRALASLAASLLAVLTAVGLAGWLSAWQLRRRVERMVGRFTQAREALREESDELRKLEEAILAAAPRPTAPRAERAKSAADLQTANKPNMQDGLMIQEIPPTQVARTGAQSASQSAIGDVIGSQLAERALTEELKASPDAARALHQKRVAIAQFELDLDALAAESGDGAAERHRPAKVAGRLAEFARELCGSPALFFAYHPAHRIATLQAHSGLTPEQARGSISFPVMDDLPERVAEGAKQGRILSMVDYLPLASLMLRRYQALRYRAWAVHGTASGAFLGVLVVLEGGRQVMHQSDALARVIRSTGQFYENAARET